MKKLLFLSVLLFGAAAGAVFADEKNITFPIADLGNCDSKESCRTYCEAEENKNACLSFAEKNGLMSRDEIEKAKKFMGQTGPGGCKGDDCRKYCEDPANRDTCMEFALKNGIISKEEAERMKKFRKLENEDGPGGCRGESCRDFCERPGNRKACFEFAKKNGLLSAEEEERFETGSKIEEAIEKSGGPGGCRTPEECKNFCHRPENVEACVEFGVKHGAVKEGEVRKMLQEFRENKDRFDEMRGEFESRRKEFEERGKRFEAESREGRRAFDDKFEGFMGRPDFGNEGPGGCKSREECESLCRDNPEKCFGDRGRGETRREEVRPENFKGGPDFDRKNFSPEQMKEQMKRFERPRMPNDNFEPREGMMRPPQQGEFKMSSEGEFRQMPPGDFRPGSFEGMPPQGGSFPPPGSFTPPSGSFTSPSSGSEAPPPPPSSEPAPTSAPTPPPPASEPAPAPTSRIKSVRLLGTVLQSLVPLTPR